MVKFNIYEDLEKVNANSLLINSDTEVASLEVDNFYLSLICYGEVNIDYGEETYYNSSDYPKIIINYFLGKINENDLKHELYVNSNNWFQAILYKKGENNQLEYMYIYDNEEIFEIEGCLEHCELSMSTVLYDILLKHLKNLKRDYPKELEELNLKGL